jgi:two-component system, OmpR family, phosphate regulon sensor histidine kinase PhoR
MTRNARKGGKLDVERIYLSFRNHLMRYSVKIYITTSVICFLVLALVQFILVYNTYDLLNRRFYYEKKGQLNTTYTKAITKDLLFPGGKKIIDSCITPRYATLERLYRTDTTEFHVYAEQMLNELFHTLIQSQNMDSLLRSIRQEEHITDSLHYLLSIQQIGLLFGDMKNVVIYDYRHPSPRISYNIQQSYGIHLWGDLTEPDEQNSITRLYVADPVPYTYAITFTFNADPYNRQQIVFSQMRPVLIMSFLSMLAIVLLFFITLRNWIKQKHLSDVKTDFINNITHEFHTPLSAIMVANKNLQNERVMDNKSAIRSLSDIIERQSHRLKLLIGQVLELADIDKLFIQKRPQQLQVLVQEILTDFSIKFSQSNLRLQFNGLSKDLEIEVDSFHFTTLLLNILDNGVKYSVQPVKCIQVSITQNETQVLITINDNGIGMSRETIRHIFDKFYRHQRDLTQNTKGLGLGLHYVKQCINAHQWDLKVESEVGKGSTFIIVIPVELA